MMPSSYIIIFCSLLYITSQNVLPAKAAIDRFALLSLKDKLTNGNPEALTSWNDSVHFCKWQGVSCNLRHMRVSALNLSNQNLGGTLTPAIGNLTFLKLLNLSCNGLRGRIPKQIGNLKRLLSLDLRKNYLEGQVPIELANCSKLQHVVFNLNNLTGEIPFWFGSMRQLKVLKLGVNKFHGTIPPSLGNLSSLECLSLSFNNLEGSIPQSLGRLSNLNLLYLGQNNLSGIIPSSLYNLSRMQDLSLGFNFLSGTLLSNIGMAFPNLQKLHVGHNTLIGTIPASVSNMSQLQLFAIYGNAFRGLVPTSLGRLQNLRRFEIHTNNLGGEGHDLDFLSSLTNCSQLHMIEMWNNKFEGILPSSIGNLSQLESLSMGFNRITGSMPDEIGQLDRLRFLDLGNNFLHGTIPYSLGKIKNLGLLGLTKNQLSGEIPDIFENLTKLIVVALDSNHFEGAIPVSLKYCKGLQSLYINQNNLSGNLPSITFGGLENLIELDVSSNSLNGPIPYEIGSMKQLAQLGLNENNFYGEIPTELGECIQLTYLNMRGNTLQGIIPSSFSSLKSLIILDLSNNNLSGTIPQEFKDLPLLETLNLSHNHFHGEVPKGGVFDNLTTISLIGNENLCDGIPQLKLPKCTKTKSNKHFKVIITVIIVISGALLTCFAICLLICKRRKHKKLFPSRSSIQNTHMGVSYKELHDATNGFSSSNLVGIGNFGSVYKGTLQHFEKPIAIKVLNLQTHGATKSFVTEYKTLSKVHHKNLLKILMSCSSVDYEGNDFRALVFEFMPNGSLESWLSVHEPDEPRNLHMNFRQRLDVAIDVGHALDYLHHDFEETIVHCDIKPSNVLLNDDMVAHLGDFGLARLLHEVPSTSREGETTTSSAIKGTIGYIPPEYGESGQITTQGDIYSYGVLMLEMLIGKKPTDNMFYEDLNLPRFCKLALPNRVLEIVDSSLLILSNGDHHMINMQNSDLELKIQECLASYARIGVACCAELPHERMDIKDVLEELLAIKEKLSTFNVLI